ncbi:Importin-9 [Grifola frondosa]|uniref:Importin-9 n=1 Tax=Grifola frondosa TaxID=5627 RepID=A0A1C7LV00_GRIFR|nr:Importin-9 [Grifola frondosa]
MASQLAQCLSATLSSDPNTRMSAELKLNELLTSPEAGLALSQLLLATDADLSLRQMSLSRSHSASIILRKYVTEHWSPYFSQFKGSAPQHEVKAKIRQAVFQGLSDPNRKIRSLCAHTLSSIANCDWPDEYPDLLNALIALLSSNSPDSVHGAMQVFTEFIKSDLTEDQILPVLRQLLPVLLNILGASEQHSPLTRSRTISVFRQCVEALFMVKDQHPQAVKEAIASVLTVWLDAFKVLLNIDPRQDVENTPNWDGLAIRIQIFKTLDTINTSFHRALTPHLRDFLTASLNHLHALFPTFAQYYLMAASPVPPSSEDDSIELTQLVCPIIDFVSSIARTGRAKEWFTSDNLHSLTGAVFNWVQMSQEDEEDWATNANSFVAQESDETLTYSVRMAGFDLLSILLERSAIATVSTFQNTIHRVATESSQARDAGKPDWWRPLEAALAAIGAQAEAILECIEDEQDSGRASPIDVESLLANVIPNLLGLSQCPFLQGRATSCCRAGARSERAGYSRQGFCRKAIHNFCQGVDDAVIVPLAPRLARDIGPFLLVTSEDTLSLVLETCRLFVEIDDGKWMTETLATSLVVAILEVWMRNNKVNILASLAASSAPGIYATVVNQALPSLCNAIASSTATDSWISGAAIDLASSLVRGAPEVGLGDGFFSALGPSLFACLRVAEDRDVIQNGITCLTLSGLDSVLAVIAKQLQSEDESGGLVIGDLIIHLLRRAGDAVLPVLPQLLQAMISRMMTAKTATFLQSLVIPFAFLIHNQRDTVLSLLESINVQGRSGLDILIQTWCENAETFQGFWAIRISTLALCSLYASGRSSLQTLMVKGDIIVRPETKNVIMTRSKTKKMPTEFTSIPFPVKALKLLLHDLQSGGEAASMGFSSLDVADVDSDDGDEEWTEEEKLHQGFKEDEFAFLSEMLGPRGMAFDNDDALDENDDEDLRNDPISQMDMRAHLLSFLRECAARNTSNFSTVVDQLTPEEIIVVRKAVSEPQ